jgi:hypothetical protein
MAIRIGGSNLGACRPASMVVDPRSFMSVQISKILLESPPVENTVVSPSKNQEQNGRRPARSKWRFSRNLARLKPLGV